MNNVALPEHSDLSMGQAARSRRFLLTLFVLLHLIAAVALATLCPKHRSPEPVGAALFALIVAHCGLLGMVAGLGRSLWLLRLPLAGLGAVTAGILLGWGLGESEWPVQMTVMLTGASSILCLFLRQIYGPLVLRDARQKNAPEALQFSIRQLLYLTTVVAVTVWCVQQALEFKLIGTGRLLGLLLLVSTILASCQLVCFWAMFGTKAVALRSSMAIVVGLVGGLACQQTIRAHAIFWMSLAPAAVLIQLASLSVLRGAGYRLLKSRQA